MIDRIKPPFSDKLPDFIYPEHEKVSVNGLFDVFFIPDKSHLIVNLRIVNLITNERKNCEGLNYGAMNLLTRGTKTRTSSQIAEKTDYFGASVHSSVNWDETVFNLNVLKNYFGKGFEIFKDCFTEAAYFEEEFTRFQNRQVSIIRQEEADLNYYTYVKFSDMLNSPVYASTLIGTEKSVSSFSRDELFNHYQENILSSPKFVVVTGNYNKEKVLTGLYEFNFNKSKNHDKNFKTTTNHHKSKILLINKPENQQVNLRLGFRVINPIHPDFPLLQLANTIFGGYFLSRLNDNLREKSGITYGISSYIDARRHESYLVIGTSVAKEFALKALTEIVKEIKIMASGKVSDEELNRAKQYTLGTFTRMNETTYHQSLMIQAILTNNLPHDYYPKLFESIKNADSESLFKVQQKYFHTDELFAVIAGDLPDAETEIRRLGIFEELILQ